MTCNINNQTWHVIRRSWTRHEMSKVRVTDNSGRCTCRAGRERDTQRRPNYASHNCGTTVRVITPFSGLTEDVTPPSSANIKIMHRITYHVCCNTQASHNAVPHTLYAVRNLPCTPRKGVPYKRYNNVPFTSLSAHPTRHVIPYRTRRARPHQIHLTARYHKRNVAPHSYCTKKIWQCRIANISQCRPQTRYAVPYNMRHPTPFHQCHGYALYRTHWRVSYILHVSCNRRRARVTWRRTRPMSRNAVSHNAVPGTCHVIPCHIAPYQEHVTWCRTVTQCRTRQMSRNIMQYDMRLIKRLYISTTYYCSFCSNISSGIKLKRTLSYH